MLDEYIRGHIDSYFDRFGKALASRGITPNQVTFLGGGLALIAMICAIFSYNVHACIFYLLNRFCDGLDGGVARHAKQTDIGGFLDVVFDFLAHAGLVVSLGIRDPPILMAIIYLLFSFIGAMTTFLAYAIIVAKRKDVSELKGRRAFYYIGGISEGTETVLFLSIMCILPEYTESLALFFGSLCWITTFGRIVCAWNNFVDN